MGRDKRTSLESQQDKEPNVLLFAAHDIVCCIIQQTISWAANGRTTNVKDRCKIQLNETSCHLRRVVIFDFAVTVVACSSTSLVVVVGLSHLSIRDFTL